MFFLEFLTKMTNKLTIMDVLGTASANDMNELNTANLTELFKMVQTATPIGDRTFGGLKNKLIGLKSKAISSLLKRKLI